MTNVDTIAGVMLGTALGDSLGLPHEGLHPARIARRLQRRPLGHGMLLSRGLLSDDTEHTCMVARALLSSGGEVDALRRSLSRQLRWWVAMLPPGVGLATLRASLRLLVGIDPRRSGVRSAGNGPAMRSALLGVCARDDAHLVELVRASTRLTHTDPRAEDGATVVARLARWASGGGGSMESIVCAVEDAELAQRLGRAIEAAMAGVELEVHRSDAGYERGVSGFVVHTVPAAVYCFVRHRGRPAAVLEAAVRLGGDTDTVGAIAGALVGAEVGAGRLPTAWVQGIRDWPISVAHIEALARALAEGGVPPPAPGLGMLVRNLGMVGLVLGHLMLRMLGR
ncbi:ADP-ribosylglycohydrolase family protein [Paraliomyxa miuraensis]|uniref:ADP-ribosylglycohydrolase family protein n=1 Tax=Paraliomyxa miuraensis TaxID=376150 RepID=UPI0022501F8D|nr:ADP-ribosylglycohydrolase family protein [Paraliomyxa miuraensis]MCX4241132.1 ADP-ribosylglycohydrolase family protein [Paraliomyxa miuraensis]